MTAQAAETTQATAIIALGVTDKALGELREEFKEVPDATEKEGYALIKAGVKKLKDLWVAVDKEAKLQKEHALTHQRRVNSEKDRIIDALKEIAEPLQTAKKDVDEAAQREKDAVEQKERDRINKIKARIEAIRELSVLTAINDLAGYEARLAELDAIVVDGTFEEFKDAAIGVHHTARTAVENAYQDRKNFEAQEAENQRKTKELDDRDAEQKRTTDIQARINRIRMTPADLVGVDLEKMEKTLENINLVDLDQGFDEFRTEAVYALSDVISKVQGMIDHQKDTNKQQEDLKTAQAETARKNKAQDEREAAEQAKKNRQREAEALKSRLPEDQKLRAYADELVAIQAPDVETPEMVAVLREASLYLSDIHKYVFDNTQAGSVTRLWRDK